MGINPIKSLGQVFLVRKLTARALVSALNLEPEDTVLEIGAGTGIITQMLVEKGCSAIAIEIDNRLVKVLKEKLGMASNLTIIQGDFLKFNLSQFQGIKIIGNLPYYISSEILKKLIQNRQAWDIAVLTTQREFAERILGKPGTRYYCPVSVICSYLFQRKKLFNIPPHFFKPSPEVMSTAFVLLRRPVPALDVTDQAMFYRVVQAAFVPQRRKTVLNNLSTNMKLSKATLAEIFAAVDLPLDLRAENTTLEQFGLLANTLAVFFK